MRSHEPGPGEIEAAHARISGHVRRTPLLETASPVAGAPRISLKLEFLHMPVRSSRAGRSTIY